jgi:uncharacterized membrane protein YqgA involved in biofilm formation
MVQRLMKAWTAAGQNRHGKSPEQQADNRQPGEAPHRVSSGMAHVHGSETDIGGASRLFERICGLCFPVACSFSVPPVLVSATNPCGAPWVVRDRTGRQLPVVSRNALPLASCASDAVCLTRMLGTLLNAAAVLVGGIAGLVSKADIPPRRQLLLKLLIGLALVWFGLKIAFGAMTSGDWRYFAKLFLVLLVSMTLGKLLGRLARIQEGMNRLGQLAKAKLATASERRFDGFIAAAILFCAAPLGFVGAIEDGFSPDGYHPLLVKGVIDGLAAFSFARMFGWPVLAAVFPLVAWQLSVALGARAAQPWLQGHQLLDPIHVVCGFIVLYVSLIVFEVKKIELGDYLPAVLVAPALWWIFS